VFKNGWTSSSNELKSTMWLGRSLLLTPWNMVDRKLRGFAINLSSSPTWPGSSLQKIHKFWHIVVKNVVNRPCVKRNTY
jgi:hypothetical protein